MNLKAILTEVESTLIKEALEKTGGDCAAAAKMLSIKRTTLVEKRRKYGLALKPHTQKRNYGQAKG